MHLVMVVSTFLMLSFFLVMIFVVDGRSTPRLSLITEASPAYEKEAEDGGEWKSETEAGGEVEFNSFICRTSFLVGMHSYA